MAGGKTHAQKFADLEEQPVKDYDPEGEISPDDGGSDSDSQESEDEIAGTEHYLSVGKSKLREKDAPALGAQYRGSRISREALQETSDEDEEEEEDEDEEAEDGELDSEEFADPDKVDLEADQDDEDAEIESDNALTQSDVDRFKNFSFRGSSAKAGSNKERIAKRPTAADFLTSSEDDGSEDEEFGEGSRGLDEDSDEEMQDGVDGSEENDDDEEEDDEHDDDDEDEEDEDEDDDKSKSSADGGSGDERAEIRKIMKEGQKSIVATISQAAKADAEKGLAVRQQRRAFDALLNIRIRLQKALVAANSLTVAEETAADHKEPYEAAEEAAIKLLNSIDGFRRSMLPETAKAKIGQKRKRDLEPDATSQAIWESMGETEELALAHRRKVLDKWSSKVRSTTAMTTSRKLGPATAAQSLVSLLDDQLLGSSDRLIKRTRTPRSCAPVQAARKVAEDAAVYDDADFYQLLLKELVDQRTADSAAGTTTDGAGVTVRWAALKEAKTRKQVDRKASKGRKLRFTVHEKIQNFMAPEDRRSWEQDAIDRFFGTLFGQKMELREDEEESDEEMGGASVQEEGLRLFRS